MVWGCQINPITAPGRFRWNKRALLVYSVADGKAGIGGSTHGGKGECGMLDIFSIFRVDAVKELVGFVNQFFALIETFLQNLLHVKI
jgi:hypothetical protein